MPSGYDDRPTASPFPALIFSKLYRRYFPLLMGLAGRIPYALNIEEELKKFLKDSRLNIDNNPAERLNRGIAIIRKNCLFAGSEAGGQRLAILLFIRCNMQSKRHLLSQMARRRSAAFEFHSGRMARRRSAAFEFHSGRTD